MSPIIVTAALGILRQMPSVAQELEAAIKEAESPDDKQTKIKEVLQDAIKLLSTLSEAI